MPAQAVDRNEGLEQKFLQLSWKLHPDNFVNATEDGTGISPVKRSSELNDAYRTLRDPVGPVSNISWVSKVARKERRRTSSQAPPELLEEVFELNESVDELREAKASGGDSRRVEITPRVAERIFRKNSEKSMRSFKSQHREWDAALQGDRRHAKKRSWRTLNELLNRRSYIRNLVTNVQKELL